MSNIDYIREYNKVHYKQFKAELGIEEYNEIKKLLKELKMGNVDLIRYAYEKLLEENIDKLTIK